MKERDLSIDIIILIMLFLYCYFIEWSIDIPSVVYRSLIAFFYISVGYHFRIIWFNCNIQTHKIFYINKYCSWIIKI